MLGQAAHVLFQHSLRKHPGYKKLADMKMRIQQACKEDKKTCPNCNVSVANLSRHLKNCEKRQDSEDEGEKPQKGFSNACFLKKFKMKLEKPSSGFAKTTVKNV